jgi:organic hydroperoxide reductase OsmC/OhrA
MAHEHFAEIRWARDNAAFLDGRYSRAHRWIFDGEIEVPASSSPLTVRVPYSREDAVDPEEAFVASLASCHMLFFLFFAAKDGFLNDAYTDRAVGILAKRGDGRVAMTEVKLRPDIDFVGGKQPTPEQILALHHRAHEACYIANSVTSTVTLETPEGVPLSPHTPEEKAPA